MTDTVQSLADTALQHLNTGQFSEAVAGFERLLAVRPDLADYWYNLGYAQRRVKRFEDALSSYQQALDRGVEQPEQVHLNRAVILTSNLGRGDEAEADLKAALAIAPKYVPALINLGGLYEERGDREQAKAAYARALEIEPDDALVLTRLAVLSDIEEPKRPLLDRIRAQINSPQTRPTDRADLGFALGQVLDTSGSYDEAFDAYKAANEASRASWEGKAAYDSATEQAMTDRIIAAFSEAGNTDDDGGDDTPIFICGMFRSGSTLTERVLSRHSRVTAGGEFGFIPAMTRTEFDPYPEAAATADGATIERLRESYRQDVARLHPDAGIVTDKQPANFRHIGLIKKLFPRATIIDTLRNPMDNCLSIWFAHLGPRVPYAVDLEHIAHWYSEYRRLMAHWRTLWPDDIHEADYDALVADPEPNIRALLDACDLEWEDACLEPHEATNSVSTLSAWQVRQPLYTKSSGRWRNYVGHLGVLREALDAA